MKKNLFLILVGLFFPVLAFSQFLIQGVVRDNSDGSLLPGALLQIEETKQSQVSDMQGSFRFELPQQKSYRLSISYLGYNSLQIDAVAGSAEQIVIHLHPMAFLQDEVVIRSTRLKADSPATFTLVDKDRLKRENTGTDLPYLLQTTPSVVVTSDAGSGIGYTGIRIRGSDITRINVTLNGIPVNDAESHIVYFVNLPDLASSVENIQIQRGIGTSSNGAAAFGASINIQTAQRSQEAYTTYDGSIGSFNLFKNTLSFGTGIGKHGFSFDGKLSKISSDGYVDRASSDLKSYYLAASWANDKTYAKLLTTSGKEKTYQSWYGIPKDSLLTNRRYNPAGEMLDYDGNLIGYYDNQTDNYQQDYYQLHLAHQLKPDWLLSGAAFLTKGEGYYDSWKNNRKFSEYGLPNVIIGDTEIKRTNLIQQKWLDNNFYGLQASLMIEKPLYEISFGSGWNRYEGDHFGYISWAEISSGLDLKQPWYFNNSVKTDFNNFVKASLDFGRHIKLYADMQLRAIDYAIQGQHDNLLPMDQQHKYLFFNPKAGVFYKLNKQQGIYLTLAKSHREPNRNAFKDADPGEEVKAERLFNIESGYKLQNNNIRFEANLFHMLYKDQLVLTGKINSTGAAILTNVPDSYRSGLETSLFARLHEKVHATIHLSVSRNKIKNFVEYVDNWNYWDDPENEPYQYSFERGTTDISFSPSVVGGAQIDYQAYKRLLISYYSSYVSRQYLDNTSTKSRSLDPYHIGKLLLSADISGKILKDAAIQLSLNNLFNEKYASNGWVYRYIYNDEPGLEDGYFPQAGFHWMLQLRIGF